MQSTDSRILFQRYAAQDLPEKAPPGFFINWLGVKTRCEYFFVAENKSGLVLSGLPIPDDGVYGGEGEYRALILSVENSIISGRDSFVSVELGAASGPWISTASLLAKLAGIKNIRAIGVEADDLKASRIPIHFQDNDLTDVELTVYKGAAWSKNTSLFFPDELPSDDMGAGARTTNSANDYRGFAYAQKKVKAYSLKYLLRDEKVIDFMHLDVQGAEFEVLSAGKRILSEKVRHLFIGTHSRELEGKIFRLLFEMGWVLNFESPCHFVYDQAKPSLEGMTTRDGEMHWSNPALA